MNTVIPLTALTTTIAMQEVEAADCRLIITPVGVNHQAQAVPSPTKASKPSERDVRTFQCISRSRVFLP
jgi:hypothetical protein